MTKVHETLIVAGLALSACEYMPGTEAYQQAQAERAISQMLIDPASAQFRHVQSHEGFVCGEVNGKNRMGAYVGFVRFIVDSSTREGDLEDQDGYDAAFDLLWQARCRTASADEPHLPFNPAANAAENLVDEDPQPNSLTVQPEARAEEFFVAPSADPEPVVDMNGNPLTNQAEPESEAATEVAPDKEQDGQPVPPPDNDTRPD